MFLLHKPSAQHIARFLEQMRRADFSYPDVGATRSRAPSGYGSDHNAIQLGTGSEMFVRAAEAVRRWQMFRLGWVSVVPDDAPIIERTTVAVIGRHFGFWSLNACRIVYVLDEPRCFGFAYGTLPEHVERGEERFTVEWRADGSVWYDILAFSRPNALLVQLGYPLSRAMQKRFARDSKKAMLDALSEPARERDGPARVQ